MKGMIQHASVHLAFSSLIPFNRKKKRSPHIWRPWDGSGLSTPDHPISPFSTLETGQSPKISVVSDLLRLGRLDQFGFWIVALALQFCRAARVSRKFDHARNSDITIITWQRPAETIWKDWLQNPVERSSSMTHGCASSILQRRTNSAAQVEVLEPCHGGDESGDLGRCFSHQMV